MKLNLWIVANCLHALEPVVSVPWDAPAVLIGARTAYVPRCAYVHQKKSDVVVDAGTEGGHLVFENAEIGEILEMVQFAFDFYRNWEDRLFEAAERLDYREIIDQSWGTFKNPVMLMDAGNNLLAMSKQYRDDEVNEDWKYMARNKRSSLEVQQYLIENGAPFDYYMNTKARIFNIRTPWINGNELSVAIVHNNIQYGRMNVVEKDRPLNPGDLLVADYLVEHLKIILEKINNRESQAGSLMSVYAKLVKNDYVSENELDYWKETSGWKSNRKYRVVVCRICDETIDINRHRSVENLIRSCFGDTGSIARIGENISFLLVDQKEKEEKYKWKQLIDFSNRFHLWVGISLVVRDIRKLYCYYDQAIKVLKYGIKTNPGGTLYHFYNYAVDYILGARNLELMRYACQVDVNNLWEEGSPDGGEQITTLRVYLNNERSLVRAANELYVHRNTLVYHIKKIKENLLCDLDNSYTREYMQISIRVRQLYVENKEN